MSFTDFLHNSTDIIMANITKKIVTYYLSIVDVGINTTFIRHLFDKIESLFKKTFDFRVALLENQFSDQS